MESGEGAIEQLHCAVATLADSGAALEHARALTDLGAGEIAQSLFLSLKTVEMHLSASYRKLDVHSRSELAETLAR